jgi:phosphoglycerate dehydrogenase-like enzyme
LSGAILAPDEADFPGVGQIGSKVLRRLHQTGMNRIARMVDSGHGDPKSRHWTGAVSFHEV